MSACLIQRQVVLLVRSHTDKYGGARGNRVTAHCQNVEGSRFKKQGKRRWVCSSRLSSGRALQAGVGVRDLCVLRGVCVWCQVQGKEIHSF